MNQEDCPTSNSSQHYFKPLTSFDLVRPSAEIRALFEEVGKGSSVRSSRDRPTCMVRLFGAGLLSKLPHSIELEAGWMPTGVRLGLDEAFFPPGQHCSGSICWRSRARLSQAAAALNLKELCGGGGEHPWRWLPTHDTAFPVQSFLGGLKRASSLPVKRPSATGYFEVEIGDRQRGNPGFRNCLKWRYRARSWYSHIRHLRVD
jgi:hypothetical protein